MIVRTLEGLDSRLELYMLSRFLHKLDGTLRVERYGSKAIVCLLSIKWCRGWYYKHFVIST